MKVKSRAILACSVLSLALASQAHAQAVNSDSSDAGAARAGGQDGVAEIVVTAQKKSETLQRVPAAITVVDNQRLTSLGVTNLTQLPNLTTGLSITPVRTQAFPFVRGVGQTVASPNADAAVATNLNGVYLPSEIAGTAFFDVDRVEILPGPQGTLYGRNAAGGVINLNGKLPGNTLAADGFVEIGNYDRRQVVAGVDLPASDNFALRVAGTIIRHDGYFNNGEDDEKTSAIKGVVVWRPSSATTVTAGATYTHGSGIGNTLESQPPQYGCGPRCAPFDPQALGYFVDSDALVSNWQIAQELGANVTVTYIGGYSKLDLKSGNSIFTGPPLAPLTLNEKIDTQSHELRVNGKFGNLDAILGIYYYNQNGYYYQRVAPAAPAFSINPFNADGHGWAIFGQGTYSVTGALRLTGGLRFSKTVKAIDGFNSDYAASGALLRVLPFSGRNSLDRVDWKAGIEFDAARNVMVYANFATGFNAGGFSAAQVVAGPALSPAAPFKEVTLNAWSGGVKSKFFGGKATLNVEGFYYDYKNYQVSARALNGQLTIYNADKATIYGVQTDLKVRPTPHDDLSFGATYLHAVANTLRAGVAVFDGYDLPYSPKWTFNASYQHSFDIGDGAQLRGLVNFKYVSSRWALYTHQSGSLIDDNTNTSLSLGYYADRDRWSIQAWIRNLEDSLVKTSCGNAFPRPPAGTGTGCFYEPPRTYGATIGFKF